MSEPGRHHFLPAFYLCHFSVPHDRKRGRLLAFDRTTCRTFGGSPDSLAYEKHFYRIEVDGDVDCKEANLVEKELGQLEGRLASIVAKVNQRRMLPSDPGEMSLLFGFVALQAARVPRVRRLFQKAYHDVGKLWLQELADNRAAFEQEFREPDMAEAEVAELFDSHCKLAYGDSTRIEMDQTTLVVDQLKAARDIADVLPQRYWILGVAQGDEMFITTDDPVCLLPARAERMHPLWSPGFGDANTIVVTPIGPTLLLIGLPNWIDRARLRLSPRQVAELNTDLALRAYRFVYFTGPGFSHLSMAGDIVAGPTADLRAADPERSIFDLFGPG
jgi:hypothetical protein